MEKKKKKRSFLSNIILIIAAVVFLFSAYKLFTAFSEYNKGDQEYEEIIEEVITEEVVEKEEDGKVVEEVVFTVDFEKLRATNSEVVAWIRFENPSKISYPVVKTSDNEKYLKRTFEGKTNGSGTIFVDAANLSDFTDKNTFIYGHNMKNGSMFGQLRKYKNESFCKENPYFYIYTPDGKEMKYQVFAVGIVEDTAESYQKVYEDDNAYQTYINHIKKISRYKTGVEVTTDSQIVSLSTCTNVTETQRLLVHGVKISEKMVGE